MVIEIYNNSRAWDPPPPPPNPPPPPPPPLYQSLDELLHLTENYGLELLIYAVMLDNRNRC